MKKFITVQLIVHILFCTTLLYGFCYFSVIRPGTYAHPYKEFISAIILLLIIYVNYLVFVPKIIYRNLYTLYIIVSLCLVILSGLIEMLIVKNDISSCVRNSFSESGYKHYIYTITWMIMLRNGGFYFFFTVLGLYKNNKKIALIKDKTICNDQGVVSFLRCNGLYIVLKISKILYFQQNRNRTTIYINDGNNYSVYSSLSDIEDYLGNKCLRINRKTLVIYDNIASFSYNHIMIKDTKNTKMNSFNFFKSKCSNIYIDLQQKLPHLEQKNTTNPQKNDDFGRINTTSHDEKTTHGRTNDLILEEIRKNSNIHASKLMEILKIPERTLRRRLKELCEQGMIEFRGSNKTGGYHIV
jgi:hypothetical protein